MHYKLRLSINLSIFLLSTFIILNRTEPTNGHVKTAFANENKKVVYLTFDDGPSVVTSEVLDILKNKEVKATFFLIGNQINGMENVAKRINNEGHSIGLHTYTHNFSRIYPNRNTFIKEMIDCRNEINRVVGISPNIIRFPGGSRRQLTKTYLERLHSYNFKVYDWNVESWDGINPKISPNRLYKDVTKNNGELSNIIMLLHCDYMHKNTCLALPRIIEYYKEKGYDFKIITDDTPELISPMYKRP
jgi:peptidoglycan/xylan/chitin deacetylase (PgdA/CDA1 family)